MEEIKHNMQFLVVDNVQMNKNELLIDKLRNNAIEFVSYRDVLGLSYLFINYLDNKGVSFIQEQNNITESLNKKIK